MVSRTARCGCGQLSIACDGEPAKVSLCHCLECQRRTGSVFGIAAFYPVAATAVTGESRIWRRVADSGFELALHFCGTCGATLFWYPARLAGRVGVAVGAFADPGFPAPSQSVFGQHRHAWVQTP